MVVHGGGEISLDWEATSCDMLIRPGRSSTAQWRELAWYAAAPETWLPCSLKLLIGCETETQSFVKRRGGTLTERVGKEASTKLSC